MTGERIRLQKFLSRAGVASRREAESLMAQGRVRVNAEVAVTPGTKVEPGRDRVELDGRLVRWDPIRWIALNKPRGTVTTRKDPRGRDTVYGLLPKDARRLRYVGRLDRDTEGLLIFTNDGDASHALLHPSSEVPREYRALVRGVPGKDALSALSRGVELDDGPARAEQVRLLKEVRGGALLTLVLREGRKREVRRLLEAVGHPVRRLRRIRFGPLELGGLETGGWRELTPGEVRALRRAGGLDPD